MKLILSQATAQAINTGAADIAELIVGERPEVQEITAVTDMANFSVTLDETNIVYEINDELFFKYVAVYMRVAKVIAPFVKPITALIEALNTDVRDIERFMNMKK